MYNEPCNLDKPGIVMVARPGKILKRARRPEPLKYHSPSYVVVVNKARRKRKQVRKYAVVHLGERSVDSVWPTLEAAAEHLDQIYHDEQLALMRYYLEHFSPLQGYFDRRNRETLESWVTAHPSCERFPR